MNKGTCAVEFNKPARSWFAADDPLALDQHTCQLLHNTSNLFVNTTYIHLFIFAGTLMPCMTILPATTLRPEMLQL